MPLVLDVLGSLDARFNTTPNGSRATALRNASRNGVEFLTSNRAAPRITETRRTCPLWGAVPEFSHSRGTPVRGPFLSGLRDLPRASSRIQAPQKMLDFSPMFCFCSYHAGGALHLSVCRGPPVVHAVRQKGGATGWRGSPTDTGRAAH